MQHTQVVHGKDLLYYCKQCDVSFNGNGADARSCKEIPHLQEKTRTSRTRQGEQEKERKSKDKKKHHTTNLKNSKYHKD